jgi:spoIIIJ-associated protein
MNNLTDAHRELVAFVELLRIRGGFDLTAHIRHPSPNGGTPSPEHSSRPEIVVEFSGPDTHLLTSRNGELLFAIEHLAAKVLGLEPEEHDRISFDAGGFKAKRDRELYRLASAAIIKVRTTATAYVFPPMPSRERRILHLALASSGLKSASSGERLLRSVVLYPEGVNPPPDSSRGQSVSRRNTVS